MRAGPTPLSPALMTTRERLAELATTLGTGLIRLRARPSRRRTRGRDRGCTRYYVSQSVLKRGRDACPIGRVPEGEVEAAVIGQIRHLLTTPEVTAATIAPHGTTLTVTIPMTFARAQKVTPSFVTRILRLTLLAPEIVEAILKGRQGAEVTMETLMKGVPVGWAIGGPVHLKRLG